MRTGLRLLLTVTALTFLAGGAGHAGPPFITDDPDPVEYHHWEFYVASIDSDVARDWSGTSPHFELNYGVITNLQLHLIVPLGYDDSPGGPPHFGVGDVELGTKYRFIHETDHVPEVGAFPLLEVPTGSAEHNLGNGHLQAFLPIWMQKSWGTWTAYGGGGYGVNSFSGRDNWGFVGAVLQKQIYHNVAVGAEVFHQTALETDFPVVGTAFNLGTVIDFSEHQHLLLSAGRTLGGGPVTFQCYIAWQWTFENKDLFDLWNGVRRAGTPP
jgi:hypothetical protein